jgi:hypothetical protein
MLYYKEYISHTKNIRGKKHKFDNNIYSFDIETSSYLILDNKVIPAIEYEKLSKKDQQRCVKQSNMYIWQFSINDTVYYGRTWDELREFLEKLFYVVPERKIVFVHNLSYEFQYLMSEFKITDVMARKSRKVMKAFIDDYNIELRCSLMMSNCALEKLPSVYLLPVEKQVGSLNYDLIRHSTTPLTEEEMKYCEYDCLVVYEYIKKELLEYEVVDKIPITSTGHVRRELKKLVEKNYKYKSKVKRAINIDPHVYNLLIQAFAGGYTHANFIYTDTIIENVDSFDFTSSYPYVMTTYLYPSTEFKKCSIQRYEDMSKRLAYILVLKLKNVRSKYFNSFISLSKCRNIRKGKYDNGRIISADELEITLTDVDFRIIRDTYDFEYEILESYFSLYKFLPKDLINFILDKYVKKTEYKNVEGKELEYSLEKAKFNSIYGMAVTKNIADSVAYNNKVWTETPLTNDEIIEKLNKEKDKAFLSFAYGVWVTAYARYNLLSNIIKCDKYMVYADTDSMKLKKGYNIDIINDYNKSVRERIKTVSKILEIPERKFRPKDHDGIKHTLGVFEQDGNYLELITQGAKKYAVRKIKKDKKTGEEKEVIEITVAGVPKSGANALNNLDDFRDNFVFDYKDTNKHVIQYNDNQIPYIIKDYLGNEDLVTDGSGCCMLPCSYTLGKALEYVELVTDRAANRAIYDEEV